MTGYLKAFAVSLALIMFAVVFVTGALGKAIAVVTLWCAEQPPVVWAAVILAAMMYCYYKDSRK